MTPVIYQNNLESIIKVAVVGSVVTFTLPAVEYGSPSEGFNDMVSILQYIRPTVRGESLSSTVYISELYDSNKEHIIEYDSSSLFLNSSLEKSFDWSKSEDNYTYFNSISSIDSLIGNNSRFDKDKTFGKLDASDDPSPVVGTSIIKDGYYRLFTFYVGKNTPSNDGVFWLNQDKLRYNQYSATYNVDEIRTDYTLPFVADHNNVLYDETFFLIDDVQDIFYERLSDKKYNRIDSLEYVRSKLSSIKAFAEEGDFERAQIILLSLDKLLV